MTVSCLEGRVGGRTPDTIDLIVRVKVRTANTCKHGGGQSERKDGDEREPFCLALLYPFFLSASAIHMADKPLSDPETQVRSD